MVTVMRNLFVDRCRKKRALSRALLALSCEVESTASPSDEISGQWSSLSPDDLRIAVERLDTPSRQVFELHARRLPMSEMARELGIPVATVGSRLFRARRKIRAMLSALDERRSSQVLSA
jgi:RNA polymerase sigma-70 factor (ECF subfamily)